MKKKEIKILVVIAVIAVVGIIAMQFFPKKNTDPNLTPTEKPKGEWVAIIHKNEVAQWFDSGVDGEYTVKGDYGEMVVEVKDGRWHVGSVECPNHTCEQMGWDDGSSFMPITCIPNNIMIGTSEWVENYLSNE